MVRNDGLLPPLQVSAGNVRFCSKVEKREREKGRESLTKIFL